MASVTCWIRAYGCRSAQKWRSEDDLRRMITTANRVRAPARVTLLTERCRHRAVDTPEGRGLDRLALREVILADIFKAAGYTTGLIGEWHLGALDPRCHPSVRFR